MTQTQATQTQATPSHATAGRATPGHATPDHATPSRAALSDAARGSEQPAAPRVTVGDLLARARARLVRLDPAQAVRAQREGALLVDIRPQWQRERDGELPDTLVIDRNHLEWRLDPTSDARVAEAVGHDLHVVVVCDEGYSSSLAAAVLQDLGLHRATDLDGGVQAWLRAGLPVLPTLTPPRSRTGAWPR